MRSVVTALFLVILAAIDLGAEEQRVTVVLDDGTRIEGMLMEYGSRVYRFRIGTQVVEIPEEKVQEIQFQRGQAAKPSGPTPAPRGDRVRPKYGSAERGAAIQAALSWLARHQSPAGGWNPVRFADRCAGTACEGKGDEMGEAGCTSLALLAFLEAGETTASVTEGTDPQDPARVHRYGDVVRNGLQRLIALQQPDGSFASQHAFKPMREAALAAAALARAFSLDPSGEAEEPARKAIAHVCAARNPYAVWRFTPKAGDNDSQITAWCTHALTIAQEAGLEVDAQAWEAIRKWYDDVTDPATGKVGYTARENAGIKVVALKRNEDHENHETWTAMGMLYRHVGYGAAPDDPNSSRGRKWLVQDLPRWNQAAKSTDYNYWYWGTRALFATDPAHPAERDAAWKAWSAAVTDALVGHQAQEGCAAGSWDADDRWGFEGGRVAGAALNALTLELCQQGTSTDATPAGQGK